MACPTGKGMLPQRGYTIFTETLKFQVKLSPKEYRFTIMGRENIS